MKNRLSLLIGIVVLMVLLAYMFTFQVRYDEVAVRTTFDRATQPVFDEATGEMIDAGSLYHEPGLKWRLPWPVQRVYKYPRKLHLLEDELEQITTADAHTIIVRTYMSWRIADPYQFFQQLGDVPTAEDRLEEMMRSLRGVISSYRFDELVNDDLDKLLWEEVEQQCLDHLRQELAEINPGYGIEVESFGIRRVLLPGPVSEDVFARMRATRERMAEDILARGRSEAASIRNEAESTRQIILDFASRRAEQIRAEGDTEAARYYTAFEENQELAIFLREIEALQQMLAHNTTFILDAHQLAVLKPFIESPGQDADEPVQAREQLRSVPEAIQPAGAVEVPQDQWELFQQWRQGREAESEGAGADARTGYEDPVTQ